MYSAVTSQDICHKRLRCLANPHFLGRDSYILTHPDTLQGSMHSESHYEQPEGHARTSAQVVLAVDDSRSMREGGCGTFALEAVTLLARALARLEVCKQCTAL